MRGKPRAAWPLHRSVRHRRRRESPAARVRLLAGDCKAAGRADAARRAAGARKWPWRPAALCLCAANATSRSTTPTAGLLAHPARPPDVPHDRAGGGRRSGGVPLPTAPVVPLRRMRAGPHRHRDHARLSLAVPLLPEHDDQTAAARSRRSKRSSPRPWKRIATPATTRSPCCRSRPAIIRGSTSCCAGCTRRFGRWA